MDSANGFTVKWKVEGETFVFVADVDPPTLRLPDGRDVELSLRGWRMLGEVLRLVDPCGSHEAPVRDLIIGASARPSKPGQARRGQAWSEEDQERVKAAFLAGDEVSDIARAVERTRGAVMARLVFLGLVEAEAAGLRYPPAVRVQPESR